MGIYRLPLLSGVLLALVFFPFYFWPLAFVALLPLFYFATSKERSRSEIFWGGAVTGAVGIGPLIYFSLALLRILPDALFFSYMIRLSSIPALLLVAGLFGAMALLYRELRPRNMLFAAGVGAALYTTVEIVLFPVFGGYYLGSLAHAVVPLQLTLGYAALGGAVFVSFLVAGVNVLGAESFCAWQSGRKREVGLAVLGVLCLLIVIYAGCSLFFEPKGGGTRIVSVAVIQIPYSHSAEELPLGVYERGVFSNTTLESYLREAAEDADLVAYPFSPVRGATYIGAKSELSGLQVEVPDGALGAWLSGFIPASKAVLFWNATVEDGKLYDQYALWQNGDKFQYRKQALYAFSDYEPAWSRALGLPERPNTTTQGAGGELPLSTGPAGGLICSELHQTELVRTQAGASNLLIAVGSDAMFPGELAGNFSLAAARLRAAENNIPVVRGNINGPSALINAGGSVESMLGYQEEGIVRGALALDSTQKTLYTHTGPAPVHAGVLVILIGAWVMRRRS